MEFNSNQEEHLRQLEQRISELICQFDAIVKKLESCVDGLEGMLEERESEFIAPDDSDDEDWEEEEAIDEEATCGAKRKPCSSRKPAF